MLAECDHCGVVKGPSVNNSIGLPRFAGGPRREICAKTR